MESRLLQHALWQGLLEQKNLTLLHPAQCAELSVQEDAARLKLKDGRELRARLVVGADGRDSWVRHQTNMPEVPTPYHQHGVVANFNIGKAHRHRLPVVYTGRHPRAVALAGQTCFHRVVGQPGTLRRTVGTHSRGI